MRNAIDNSLLLEILWTGHSNQQHTKLQVESISSFAMLNCSSALIPRATPRYFRMQQFSKMLFRYTLKINTCLNDYFLDICRSEINTFPFSRCSAK